MAETVRAFRQGGREGLGVSYDRRRRQLVVCGWYDTMAGIQPLEIPLAELAAYLQIPRAHWEAAAPGARRREA